MSEPPPDDLDRSYTGLPASWTQQDEDGRDVRNGAGALLAPKFLKLLKSLGNRPQTGLLSVFAKGNCYGCPSPQALRLQATPKRLFSSFEFSSNGSPQAADRKPVRFDRC